MDDLTENQPPASLALDALGIPHQVFRHAAKVDSLEQAARERGQQPEQVVRSILFRLGEDEYLMALVSGPAQISWKKLRKYVGQSRLTMASEDEVLAVTGYRIGAVSPFGVKRAVRVLVDPGILKQDMLSLGSGVRGVAILIKSPDLMRGLKDPELTNLLEP